jgi:ATP-dependent protease ClpP protease subunit
MLKVHDKYLLSARGGSSDDEEEDEDVEGVENSIFFYTPVTKKSCLSINKKLKILESALLNVGNRLNIPPPDINLHINSPGGSLLDVFSTIDYIKNSRVPVHSIIEGSAASAATLMSVVAQKRSMSKHSVMLIHQLSSGLWGKFEDLKDDMKNNEMFMNMIYDIYGEHTKIPKATLKEILTRDIYFDAKTCLKYKLVDAIID